MDDLAQKTRAPRNRTLTLSTDEIVRFSDLPIQLTGPVSPRAFLNRTINQNLFDILDWLPDQFVDLLFLDPPYNLRKRFQGMKFEERSLEEYAVWLESWFGPLQRILKPTASVYFCGDWRSSGAIQRVMEKHLIVHSRITWEREKGRGASKNW